MAQVLTVGLTDKLVAIFGLSPNDSTRFREMVESSDHFQSIPVAERPLFLLFGSQADIHDLREAPPDVSQAAELVRTYLESR